MVENFCMVLFSFFFFFLQFVFISLRCKIFCDSGFFVFCFFIKHLRSRTQTQYKRRPPTPTPGAPAGLGTLGGGPLGCFVAVFLVSGAGGQVRGPRAGGIVQQFHGEMVTRKDT